jgi:serine/threonine-protein kinase
LPEGGDEEGGFAAGQRVGPYVLERELGRGGMGVVWLAARADGAYERRVALKLPHTHLLTGALRQRFARERDILARLSHPHIAQLYDAGVAADGQPYLALEQVEGTPITRYCLERSLPIAARLDLAEQVLDAVRYAHARLVVHRDLKPSNILVTPEGQVKLLDFGIAKLLDADDQGELTRIAGRAVTPEYCAPEQLHGGTITTAVDVYALGVVLYELLTGVRPLDRLARGRVRGASEAGGDAPLASTRASDAHAKSVGLDGARTLRKRLAGDLDAVLAKAVEEDAARRYASAEAFADDLARYRRLEPVLARRVGYAARAFKFARRHRIGVAFACAMVVTVVAGVVAVGWEALRMQREAERANATRDFLVSVFRASDPRVAHDKPAGQMTAKELLDGSVDRIETEFAKDPQTQLELLGITAEIYGQLLDEEKYQSLQKKRVELARRLYGDRHPIVFDGRLVDVWADIYSQNYAEANRALEALDRDLVAANADDTVQRAEWWLAKGEALQATPGADAERRQALEKAVALYARKDPGNESYVAALANLGNVHFAHDEYAEAKTRYQQALEAVSRVKDRDDGDVSMIETNLAQALQNLGDIAGAENAYGKAAELTLRSRGEKDPNYWHVVANYARLLHLRGERQRADAMFESLLRVIPADWKATTTDATVKEMYGASLSAEGRPAEGVALLEAALVAYLARPLREYDLRRLQEALGSAYDRAGRSDDAREMFRAALAERLAKDPPASPPVLALRERWGRFLLDHGDAAGAEAEFRGVLAGAAGAKLLAVAMAHAGLARISLARRDAATAKTECERALATLDAIAGVYDVRAQPYIWRIRSEVSRERGDLADARQWAQRALEASQRYDAPESREIAAAKATLVALAPKGRR